MFNTYMGMLVWPMIALGWVVNLMQRGTASLERINEIQRERPSIAAPRAARQPFDRTCAARSSSAAFGGLSAGAALDGVDLRIPAGRHGGDRGATGAARARW